MRPGLHLLPFVGAVMALCSCGAAGAQHPVPNSETVQAITPNINTMCEKKLEERDEQIIAVADDFPETQQRTIYWGHHAYCNYARGNFAEYRRSLSMMVFAANDVRKSPALAEFVGSFIDNGRVDVGFACILASSALDAALESDVGEKLSEFPRRSGLQSYQDFFCNSVSAPNLRK